MGVYVITNGEGVYIRKDETTGKYVTIPNFKMATQWDSIRKANSVLNNCIARSIRSDYAVQLLESSKFIEKENLNVQRDVYFENGTDGNLDEWISKINAVIDIIANSDTKQEELNRKLSNVDKKIVDVEHYIEFGKFNAYQGWMCFKMMQNLLRERRRYKNEIQAINLVKQYHFDNNSLVKLSKTISEIQHKRYTPRAIPELFIAGKKIII